MVPQLDPLVWALLFLQQFDTDMGAAYLQLVHDAMDANAAEYALALQVRGSVPRVRGILHAEQHNMRLFTCPLVPQRKATCDP